MYRLMIALSFLAVRAMALLPDGVATNASGGTNAVVYGDQIRYNDGSVGVGLDLYSIWHSVAVGMGSIAVSNSVSIGNCAQARPKGTSVGFGTYAGTNAVAIGHGAVAGMGRVQIGYGINTNALLRVGDATLLDDAGKVPVETLPSSYPEIRMSAAGTNAIYRMYWDPTNGTFAVQEILP